MRRMALLMSVLVLASCARSRPAPGGEPDPDTLLVGAYSTDTLASADSRGLVVTLRLDSTRVATLSSDHLDGQAPITDRGAWEELPGGIVRVTLASREIESPPDTVDFSRHGRTLRHEGHRFGRDPIELRRARRTHPDSPENTR